MRLTLDLPRRVRAGDPIPIAVRVTNSGTDPVELYLRGQPPAFDIIVARADGLVVWHRLEGQPQPDTLQLRLFAPGESLEFRTEWDQRGDDGRPVGPGSYIAEGALLTDATQALRTPAVELKLDG